MQNPKIIAVDFDGTLATDEFPQIGEPIQSTVAALLKEQADGAKIILWTCRRGERLQEAVEWCKHQGIFFDAANENLPEIIERYGGDTRKVSATEYWDDKAVRMPPPDTTLDCVTE